MMPKHITSEQSAPEPTATDAFEAEQLSQVLAAMIPGPTLILEHRQGLLAAHCPGALTSDRLFSERALSPLMLLCDPARLPLPASSFACIAGLDVMGHSPSPAALLQEIERVLMPGGRLVMVEPWTGFMGRLFHLSRHKQRVWSGYDPWFDACPPEQRERGNAATARTCLVTRSEGLAHHAPALSVTRVAPFGGLAEWCGLRPPASVKLVRCLLACDRWLPRWLSGLWSSRALIVIEKTAVIAEG